MSDFVTRYIIMLFSASAILAVSVILLMLSVPLTNEWKNFRTVRLCLAFTCLVLSASDFVSCFAMDSHQEAQLFSTLTLIVASYQAMLFTTASLVFVQSTRVHRRSVLTQLGVITAAGVSLLVSQYRFPRLFAFLFAAAIAAYIAQIVFYTLAFRKDYKSCVNNYRIKAGFIINARKEHQQAQEEKQAVPETEKEIAAKEETDPQAVLDWADKLRVALESWVAEKHYIDIDSNPDKVAKELGTTKNLLNCYFSKYEHITFREWRTRLRIKEAERILCEEDGVVVSSLHELVGVSDKSNFRRHFKQLTGMTPNEYRKQVRK